MAEHVIRNLDDLHAEKERVRQAYQAIEQNWSGSVSSTKKAAPWLLKALSISKKIKAKRKSQKPSTTKVSPKKVAVASFPKRKKSSDKNVYRSAKSFAKSLLIWEAASLVVFVAAKGFLYYRKKKNRKISG